MVRPIIFLTVVCASFVRADSFDFTPGQVTTDLDGIKSTQLVFRHGEQQIGYTPPGGWSVQGRGSTLSLMPAHGVTGEVVVEDIADPAPASFTEAQVKTLREQASSLIPGKAEHVEIPAEKLNDFRVDGHEVFESVTAYSYYGQKLKSGFLVINYNDRWLRCRVRAPAADFKAVYENFRRSLFSWNTL